MHQCPYLSCRKVGGGLTEDAKRCIQSIERGNEDVPIGLLLSLLPRIRTLRFRLTYSFPEFCVRMINHIACDSTATALSQMTTVSIDFSYGDYPSEQRLALLILFSTLPSMTTLCAKNIGTARHPCVPYASPNSSNVTEVVLQRTSIYPPSLQAFLVAFKALKKFTYESFDPRDPRAWFNATMITNTVLRSARDSLTHLTLYSHFSTPSWMGSLHYFRALTHIYTDWSLLVDEKDASAQQLVANLPSSIQQLHLKVDCHFKVRASSILIENLVLAKPSRFPALTYLLLLQMESKKSTALMKKAFVRTAARGGFIIRCDTEMDPDLEQFKWHKRGVNRFPSLRQNLERLVQGAE